jgi:hypothetical protein
MRGRGQDARASVQYIQWQRKVVNEAHLAADALLLASEICSHA